MIVLLLVLFGLCCGSFVNALVWRMHEQARLRHSKTKQGDSRLKSRDLSILTGRSMCSRCHHQLGVFDLLPLVSWALLRGKCRYCHRPIEDPPLVEAGLAVLFVLSYVYWPAEFTNAQIVAFGVWLLALTGFMALTVYDLRWRLLPNKIVFPLIALGAVQVVVQTLLFHGGLHQVMQAAGSVAVASGLFYLIFQLSAGRWIGGGDVKLGFALGLLLGSPFRSILMLFLASLAGTAVSLGLIYTKRATRKSHIPFGPFLIIGTVIAQLFGGGLIDWYLHHLLML